MNVPKPRPPSAAAEALMKAPRLNIYYYERIATRWASKGPILYDTVTLPLYLERLSKEVTWTAQLN